MYVCDIDRDCKATSVVASRAWYYAIGLTLLFRLRLLSSKGTSSRNFTAIRGRFVLGTARVKALGWLEKKNERKKKKNRNDEHSIFTTVEHLSPLTGKQRHVTLDAMLGAIVELGQHQLIADLTVLQ